MYNTTPKENGISFGTFFIIFTAMSIVLILTMVKIYLSHQIYHESKIVNQLIQEVSALKAEQVILEQHIETLRFKQNITDKMFKIDNDLEWSGMDDI